MANVTNAQVLYSENFDNLTVGNVGTDLTGQTPGQGNWYTIYDITSANANPNWFQIKNEPNRGKVITLQSPAPPVFGNTALQQRNIDQLINNRTPGNDVIKFEVDFYTGSQNNETIIKPVVFSLTDNNSNIFINNTMPIANFTFDSNTGVFYGGVTNGNNGYLPPTADKVPLGKNKQDLILSFNTWIKCVFYVDYSNNKVYFEIPSLNVVISHDFLRLDTDPNGFNKFTPKSIVIFSYNKRIASTNKFDNIKITALKNVPLSVSEYLNDKFNIFPNPATNVLNITNTNYIIVEQLAIYDINGKKIKEEKFNNKTNVNIESLQSGTYLLHLKTKSGAAVKKFIKK